MNWDDARILLAVGRARNPTEAARHLGVSHTTVARRIATLERTLEVRLIDRTPDGARLTAEGAALARLAEPMAAAADAMLRHLAGADRRLVGRVRVTSTEALGARVLAPRLAELAAHHPGLTVELVPDPRTLSLARREADIAVRLVRPREHATLGRRIGRVAYAAYASPGYLAGPRAPERLLIYDAAVSADQVAWLVQRFAGAQIAVQTASTLALCAAAVAGGGVTVLPCFVGDGEPGLVRLGPPSEPPASDIWLVIHRDLRRSARARTVADHIAGVIERARPALEGRAARRDERTGRA